MELKRILREKNNKPTIVVIGGGFAGINFVKSIKSQDCNVILVDKHNYHQFQPLLYQVAISGLEPDSIVSPKTKEFPRGLPMVAQTAIQQGHYLANTIFIDNPKLFVFKNKGSMATIGMKNAVADVNSILFQGKTGWFIWSIIHLISITSFKNRLAVGFSWMLKYFSYDKANQLIIRQISNPNSFK